MYIITLYVCITYYVIAVLSWTEVNATESQVFATTIERKIGGIKLPHVSEKAHKLSYVSVVFWHVLGV